MYEIIKVYDRVKETTTTIGTGNITLNGAVFGFQSFHSTVGVGNKTYYGIIDKYNGTWEIGIGTLLSSDTLTREQVVSSSNNNFLIDFSNKIKFVIIDIPACESVSLGMLNYTHNQTLASASWNINHNLDRFVSVTVVDSAGTEIEGEVIYIDENNVQVNFSASFSGTVYCN